MKNIESMNSHKNRLQALEHHPHKCAICGRFEGQPHKLVNHHIKPVFRDRKRGLIHGDVSPDNSRLDCHYCHIFIEHKTFINLLKSPYRKNKDKDGIPKIIIRKVVSFPASNTAKQLATLIEPIILENYEKEAK